MTITFELNGERVSLDTAPNRRLIDILRDDRRLVAAKSACQSGACGACAVMFNGSVYPSCQVPAFRLRDAKVVTLEGFKKEKNNEYADIATAFARAGVTMCGRCEAGKVLITAELLRKSRELTREEVARAFDSVRCRCTDVESLVDGVLIAAALRANKREGR
jgi:carbon-monoxide dehydrogenase small subunit